MSTTSQNETWLELTTRHPYKMTLDNLRNTPKVTVTCIIPLQERVTMLSKVNIATIDDTIVVAMGRETGAREVEMITTMLNWCVEEIGCGRMHLIPCHTKKNFGWVVECWNAAQADDVVRLLTGDVDVDEVPFALDDPVPFTVTPEKQQPTPFVLRILVKWGWWE